MNEDIVSPLHVRAKLAQLGLICKDLEWLEDDACLLGLMVEVSKEPCSGDVELQFQKYLMP